MKANYDEEKHILKVFLHDMWYQRKLKPQQLTAMVLSALEEFKNAEDPLSLGEKLEPLQISLWKVKQSFRQWRERNFKKNQS